MLLDLKNKQNYSWVRSICAYSLQESIQASNSWQNLAGGPDLQPTLVLQSPWTEMKHCYIILSRVCLPILLSHPLFIVCFPLLVFKACHLPYLGSKIRHFNETEENMPLCKKDLTEMKEGLKQQIASRIIDKMTQLFKPVVLQLNKIKLWKTLLKQWMPL